MIHIGIATYTNYKGWHINQPMARGGWTQLTFAANFDLLIEFFNPGQ